MRAVVFQGSRRLALTDMPDPAPGEGEVVVEMKASGMCGSDLKFYRAADGGASAIGIPGGAGPVVAGHEPCGVVAEVGPGVAPRQARVGQRVMVHHYRGCGDCRSCRQGWPQLCPHGFVVYGVTAHGGHAPWLRVPAHTLVPLPEELSFASGAAIACGTGTAYAALGRVNLTARDTVALFGQGPVGLSATQLAGAMGARVLALDVSGERRALAAELGADAVIDPRADDPVQALRELTGGAGVDIALDCSGAPEARAAAVRSTRTWGTIGLVGEGDTLTLEVSQDLLRKQRTVIGSWTFSSFGQADCARFVAERGVPVERLFTHRFALDEAEAAYQLFDTQTTGKGVFLF